MKFTPLHNLWLLVAIQFLVLAAFLGAHFWLQSHNTHMLDQSARILARLPEVRQKIQNEPDPEKIRSEAIGLLDVADQGNQTMVVMEIDIQKMNDAVGLVFFILTAYLTVCAYKLNRQNQDAAKG